MAYNTITRTFEGTPAIEIRCWCGISFAVPKSLYEHYSRQNDREPDSCSIHCPLGHSMVPAGPSQEQKLRDRLARERAAHDQETARLRDAAERAERRASAARGVVTRIKNRVGKGVCPCCNRTFTNLGRHMKGQHPDWMPEGSPIP